MSKKSAYKMKLPPSPAKPPRPLEEIQKEYAQLVTRIGQIQYQIYVFNEDLDKLNKEMWDLNHEGAARQELDRKAAEEAQKEVANEQS